MDEILNIPRHIAIIMDGNRRWAQKYSLPAICGHWEGAEALTNIVRAAMNLGTKVLTVFAFSTENWTRDPAEVEGLLQLFEIYLRRQKEQMIAMGVRLNTIGQIDAFPTSFQESAAEIISATRECDKIDLVLALNYGGRDEICRAWGKWLDDYERKSVSREDLCETKFAKYLDTYRWGDPDLVIRTSGEMRLSNFLLWQICYAEVVVTDVLWPDFTENDLMQAVLEYQRRQRRLGGT